METEHQPPSQRPCWNGRWLRPDPVTEFWTLAADARTVNALPRLHPWRLADVKGTRRVLTWLGASGEALVAATHTASAPRLPTDEKSYNALLPMTLPGRSEQHLIQQLWLSAYARLEGSWMPPLAVLPRGLRDFDDPGTRWSTESLDFAERHSVHTADTRYAADVLAPHVMALILDVIPASTAITMAGDALHVWLPFTESVAEAPAIAQHLAQSVVQLRDSIPSFILGNYPDRSGAVEAKLADKASAAAAYRSSRKVGRSDDPTLQRIYEQARANWEARSNAGHVSSES